MGQGSRTWTGLSSVSPRAWTWQKISFVRRIEQALLVPKDAVLRRGDERYVLVVADGHAEQRGVELGAPVGDQWYVRSGIGAGDDVIVSGNEKLRAGQPVRVVELPPPGPPTVPAMRAADESDGGAGL